LDCLTISTTGSEKLNVAPEEVIAAGTPTIAVESLFLAHILPPWASILFFDIYSYISEYRNIDQWEKTTEIIV
jgi:hypothetical protein